MKNVKIILSVILLLTVAFSAGAQNALYKKYSSVEGISKVYISSAMFRLMGKSGAESISIGDSGEIDLSALLGKLSGLYILTSEKPDVSKRLRADFENMTKNDKLELMMEAEDGEDLVRMFASRKDDFITNFFLCASEPDGECTVLQLTGQLTDDDLAVIMQGTAH